MKPRVCILKTDGTNCDQETAHAFTLAGAAVETVLLNRLRLEKNLLHQFQILVIPGGFSYGDDIASGKILALEMMLFLHDQLREFLDQGNLIIGICNGFQVLVRAQLLPSCEQGKQEVTLVENDSGKFECRWVELAVEPTNCIFTRGISESIMLPVAHAEGKFFTPQESLEQLELNNLVVFRYAKEASATNEYPYNPNGSMDNIAGMCDSTGRILGMMPHPERFIYSYHHPLYRRETPEPVGLKIFSNAVEYAKQA